MRSRSMAILSIAVIVAIFLALVLPSAQRSTAGTVAWSLVVLWGTAALLSWPTSLAFIEQHPRRVLACGVVVGVVGLGLLGLMFAAALRPGASIDMGFESPLIVVLAGFMISSLPRMARRVAKSRAEFVAMKTVAATPPAFSGPREGLRASLTVLRDYRVFLQVAGPWALLLGAGFAGGAAVLAMKHLDPSAGWAILVGVLALLAVLFLSVPTITVAWHRWIIQGLRPPRMVALPDRAALGYLRRLLAFSVPLAVADKLVTEKATELATQAHMDYPTVVGSVASGAIDILAVMLFSSYALVLPAVAVGDRAFPRTAALVEGRRMWPGYPIGLVISLAPFFAASWALGFLADALPDPKYSPPKLGLLAVELVLYYAAFASVATYLSRAYLAVKSKLS